MPSLPLALTQGDPAGIGPELILRAWLERRERNLPPFACIASPYAAWASAMRSLFCARTAFSSSVVRRNDGMPVDGL